MSLALVKSRALVMGLAPEVTVEVHLSHGLPSFTIVGLPDLEVRESRERVRAAIQNSGFEFPLKKITVNLAPADLPKDSGRFDLPIALGILSASQYISAKALAHHIFAGELSLSGALRPIRGAFAMACGIARQYTSTPNNTSTQTLFLPLENAEEAALVPKLLVYAVSDLKTLIQHFQNPDQKLLSPQKPSSSLPQNTFNFPDMQDVIGQPRARRALEIAASGRHHLLMIGPPGTGKTMLAQRLIGILPPLTTQEALSSSALLSASSIGFSPTQWRQRPFRAPHHSATAAALIGGKNPPQPGEISLAHLGVLFLDELPEFSRHVLEMLREPLENGYITLSRAAHQIKFPADCQVIAAMNPCPCGWKGSSTQLCHCTSDKANKYLQKISGPLLDRIDLQVNLSPIPAHLFTKNQHSLPESSFTIAQRVQKAQQIQFSRQGKLNAALNQQDILQHCQLNSAEQNQITTAATQFNWSARSYYRILKIARTIADLEENFSINEAHIAEAISFRRALPEF